MAPRFPLKISTLASEATPPLSNLICHDSCVLSPSGLLSIAQACQNPSHPVTLHLLFLLGETCCLQLSPRLAPLVMTQGHPQSYLHVLWVLPSPSCQPTSALAPRPSLDSILLGFFHSIITIWMFPIFKFVFSIAYLPHSHVNANVNS